MPRCAGVYVSFRLRSVLSAKLRRSRVSAMPLCEKFDADGGSAELFLDIGAAGMHFLLAGYVTSWR